MPSDLTAVNLALEQLACYGTALACAGGGAYGYAVRGSVPSLVAGLGIGALYGYSGRLIGHGRWLDGVDLSILTSLILVGAMGPRAYRTGAAVPMAMTGVGTGLLARMGYVSYCLRQHP